MGGETKRKLIGTKRENQNEKKTVEHRNPVNSAVNREDSAEATSGLWRK